MSIYKEDHRGERTFIERVRGFFGARCESYVTLRRGVLATSVRFKCVLPMGHAGRHRDNTSISWTYGDNLLNLGESYYLLKTCHLHLKEYLRHLRAENLPEALEVTNLLDDVHKQLLKELSK
jgi:hypothetical protein